MSGTRFSLEVQPRIPAELKRLEDLASDLFYSWDRQVRRLFTRLDQDLWGSSGHNPKTFLRRVSQERLEAAVNDRVFMEDFQRVLAAYETYHEQVMPDVIREHISSDDDLIAYFCAEFGFHESLPIYSGGLGVLSGDHSKAASDLDLPFIGVGLMYRHGYFRQTIDGDGRQQHFYPDYDLYRLPLLPVVNDQGHELRVSVEFPGRDVQVRVWKAAVGRSQVLLLDTDQDATARYRFKVAG